MRKVFVVLFAVATLAFPTVSSATEPNPAILEKIEEKIAKEFPRFRPYCAWEQIGEDHQRIYQSRPGAILFKDGYHVAIIVRKDGIVLLQDSEGLRPFGI